MVENEAIVNLMKTIPFFRELTKKEMNALASLGSNVMRFNPSESIIQEGYDNTIQHINKYFN